MLIKVLSVTIETVPTAKGSYQKASVAYKDDKGKVAGKNIVSFVYPKVWEAIASAKAEEFYNVTNEKIGTNWNWTAIEKSDGTDSPVSKAPTATTVSKGTYETPEERAQKQVYIIRQSSISSAIAYATGVKAVKSVDELLGIAKTFENFVFGGDSEESPVMDGDVQ